VSTAHTPGPWGANLAPDGTWRIDSADASHWIAKTVPMRNLTTKMAEFDTSADARLIAAAPDLLNACMQVIQEFEQFRKEVPADTPTSPCIATVRAAIAKATS